MKKITYLIAILFAATIISSCKKDKTSDPDSSEVTQQILNHFSSGIAFASYTELAAATSDMHVHIQNFRNNQTASGLNQCRADWKKVRSIWEQTEAYLFGPAATEEIDPRIDTWPVNFNDLEIIINNGIPLNEAYINNLDDALKGFHPTEYLLFGNSGNKSHTDFTPRELEYLEALSLNLKTLTIQLAQGWNPGVNNSFHHDFTMAGNGSSIFITQQSAFVEMVSAMSGICDEVANGKINEPFIAQDPSLEESPFSKNSITDFTNNIKGVQNVYLGNYSVDGTGVEDFVKKYNLSLDATIKTKINSAIASLNNITDPFGTAIVSQPIQVQNAINAINDLKMVLDDNLLPLVQQHVN